MSVAFWRIPEAFSEVCRRDSGPHSPPSPNEFLRNLLLQISHNWIPQRLETIRAWIHVASKQNFFFPQHLGVLLTHRLFLTFITEGKYYSISQIENSEDDQECRFLLLTVEALKVWESIPEHPFRSHSDFQPYGRLVPTQMPSELGYSPLATRKQVFCLFVCFL